MRAFASLAVLLLCCAAPPTTTAQSTRSVRGSVVDATGAVVPGLELRLLTKTGKEFGRTISGPDGTFVFRSIRADSYTLTNAASAGFGIEKLRVNVSSDITNLSFVVPLASVEQTVTVDADAGLSSDAAANKDAVALSGKTLESLPIFDQDYVAALTPFLDPGSSSTSGVTLVVDGVELTGTGVTPSAIQEVKINNDPYTAESNRPGRGRIEVTTAQGGQQYHGTLNFFFRDATLNAENNFAVTKPPEQRRIYEGYLSGPVGKGGHTGFLLSASRKEEDLASFVHAFGTQGLISDNILTPKRTTNVAFRVGRDFSDAHRASLQYDFQQTSFINQGVGGLVLASAGTNYVSTEHTVIFNDRYIVTPKLTNQFNFVFQKQEDTTVDATSGPSLIVKTLSRAVALRPLWNDRKTR